MEKEVTLGSVYRNTENKDGKPYKTKKGKSFVLTVITTLGGGDEKLSGLDFDGWTEDWKKGQRVKIDIFKKGNYWNFKQLDSKFGLFEELNKKMVSLHERLEILEKQFNEFSKISPEEEIKSEENEFKVKKEEQEDFNKEDYDKDNIDDDEIKVSEIPF